MADRAEERSSMESIDGSKDVRLDIETLASTLQRRLNAAPQYSEKRCIYRVQKLLRQANEQAYTPVLVSIGPLHHNDEKLLPMEAHKVKYLQSFLICDPQANDPDFLKLCLGIVKNKEAEIRNCYADTINLSSDDFCEMVLVDSAFIIQLFRKGLESTLRDEDDYMYNNPGLVSIAFRDIQLAENQLPFFILKELYHAAFPEDTPTTCNPIPSFTEIARKSLDVNHDSNEEETNYFHLLHLVVSHRSPTGTTTTNNKEDIQDLVFPAATQLREAGINFQVIKDSSTNMLSIQFDKGILKMPTLCVSDDSEYEFRNMVAFEQCNYRSNKTRYFSDYQYFLDCLISSPEDVKLLSEVGIIQNLLGSPHKVSKLINSLSIHVSTSLNGYYYEKISLQLQDHCKKRWNRHRATLMHTYFRHPWAAISVVYAIVLLLLTIIQVVAGIMAIP